MRRHRPPRGRRGSGRLGRALRGRRSLSVLTRAEAAGVKGCTSSALPAVPARVMSRQSEGGEFSPRFPKAFHLRPPGFQGTAKLTRRQWMAQHTGACGQHHLSHGASSR